MLLTFYCLTHVRKGLLQEKHHRFCSLVKLLSIYFSYLNLLNHSYPVLKNIFSQELCIIGKIPLDEAKKRNKTIEKVEMSKMPTVNPLF